jgi:hypothetical protein
MRPLPSATYLASVTVREAARTLGVCQSTVKRWRRRLGISRQYHATSYRDTPRSLAFRSSIPRRLLGTMTDADLARVCGVPVYAVSTWRVRLGIAPHAATLKCFGCLVTLRRDHWPSARRDRVYCSEQCHQDFRGHCGEDEARMLGWLRRLERERRGAHRAQPQKGNAK